MSYSRADEQCRGPLVRTLCALLVLMGPGAARCLAQGAEGAAVVASAATPCLRLRESPSQDAQVLDCMPPSTRISLLDSSRNWGRVRLADGKEGWVALRLVSRQGEAPLPPVADVGDRVTLLRRLGELEARTAQLEQELAAQEAEFSLLKQSAEAGSELFVARLEESDRLLGRSAALRQRLEEEKAELAARLGAVESKHAEVVAELESRLRAAESFLAASEAERRALAETMAASSRASRDPGAGALPPVAVKPLRVSIPAEGAAAPSVPPAPGRARAGADESVRNELLAVVESWAAAWSERRVDDYLSYYSSEFRPPSGTGRAEWERDRRARVGRADPIAVTVALMDLRIDGATRAEVDLIQSYDSGAYSDTVLKTLTLSLEQDRWRIVGETVTEQ